MTVLVDSWSWIEYWRGGRGANRAAHYIESKESLVVSTINLVEVYHWILMHYDERVAREKLTTIRRRCFIIPVDEEIALEAATIKYRLKMALADSIIVATSNKAQTKVLTGDSDFKKLHNVIYIGN